ncbi:helix-turn-helix domain-containing protein [Actinomadura opuntiae]|uniref:helix-turn-helix domain-containing protein n=1 Tax=Actinomadura sp. OS1-43 TaxID=604315 RepID=UPI00255AEFF9|nr:helix-turn-helix domain-containing protein [Actinomadura sp. OS1-43]MDL4815461.1 helix-turn-helix domain-containing protein [Actinomadura sp. OS1-43]
MSTKQIALTEDSSWERVKAAQASKLMTLAPPWLLWPLIAGVGTALHMLFGRGSAVAWSAIGLTLGSVLLTGVTWLVAHERGFLGRGSATATTAAVSMWVTACSVAGFTQPVILWFWVAGGLVTAAAWNIRTVIRSRQGGRGVTDALAFLFDQSKDKANLDGARMATVKAGERKIEAAMALPAGEKVVADIQKKTEHIEGAMGLPPGTMTVAPNLDRADLAHVTFSDPRVMRSPIPWPGPSRPGGSIAEPLRPAVWQDGEDVEHILIGHHVQAMGKTGAGKSIGAAWNYLAEIVTRHDAAVFAADITKGDQSLGPLRPALHRFETTKGGVRSLINDMHSQLKPRTDWLSARGFANWEPGCGLTYQVGWFEEVPDIFDALSDKDIETFLKLLKAIRSAGGSIILSLQRSDWTQMPTIARGQLANLCFGVANSQDAAFGLSEAQDDAGARPELWGSSQPGMAYLDAPSIDRARIAMPLRTFAWLKPDGVTPDTDALRAHAEQWPAAAKTIDEFTAAIVSSWVSPPTMKDSSDDDHDDIDRDDWSPTVDTEDPDPEVTGSIDDPITDDPEDQEFTFGQPSERLSAAELRTALLSQLATWLDEGREDFATKDLAPVWTAAGASRQTVQRLLRKLRDEGVLGYDDEAQRHTLLQRPAPVPA